MNNAVTEIPVLDISTARNADGSFNQQFVQKLRDAAHRVGFFQIVGYAKTENQDQQLLETIAEFFAKPVEQKLKLDNRNSAQFRGYTRMGTEITRGRPMRANRSTTAHSALPSTPFPRTPPT